MATSVLSDFTLATTINPSDHIVGYSNSSLNGERRWTYESLVNQIGPFGFRNKLINAQGLINQRVYVSGTSTTQANQYTVDRWRVVASGQNLAFSTSQNIVTFTAPAGGVEQVVEGLNVESGTYVLNWTGTASATVNGTSRTKGETFSLTGGSNVTVRFSSGTFSLPQLEKGNVPTAFEHRPIGTELALCQRYYEKSYNINVAPGTVSYFGMRVVRTYNISLQTSDGGFESIHFSTKKRSAPAIVIYSPHTGTKDRFYDWSVVDRTVFAYYIGDGGFEPGYIGTQATIFAPTYHWTADAEL